MLRQLRSFCIVSAAILAQYTYHLPDIFDPMTWVGSAATIVNVCNPKSTTEIKIINHEPVVILHGFMNTDPKSIRGISFGHTILVARNEKHSYEYLDIIDHELAHVKQHSSLGRLYTVAYGVSVGVSFATTGTYEENNPMEWGPYNNDPVAWWWEDTTEYQA